MGQWEVDATSEPGILRCKLTGTLTLPEAAAFVAAHNLAIDNLGTADYKVWVDLSELVGMSAEASVLVEKAKRHSSQRPNFRGSSVLVSRGAVALQHRHTSIRSGVMSTEVISDDVAVLREHLRTVYRR